MPNRIIDQLEAGRAVRRQKRMLRQTKETNPEPGRSQSLPIIRIVTTFTDEENETMSNFNPQTPERQHESQEEDELERLRAQIQQDTARKFYSMSALQHEHDIAFAAASSQDPTLSRVAAQRTVAGPPTVPDTATFVAQERVMRRFPTAPVRREPIQPLQLHMELEEDDTPGVVPPASDTKARMFCGIPAGCPPPPETNGAIPGIEMQESFRSMFEPLNERARQLFGAAQETDDGAASAVTEPFDNRSLQRNATWSSVQDYLGKAWSFQKDPTQKGTPTSVTRVPGESISPVASFDEMEPRWDTNEIASRMEASLRMTPSTIREEDNTASTSQESPGTPSNTYFTRAPGESSTARIPFCGAADLPTVKPSTPNSLRTKFASELPNDIVRTKRLGPKKPPVKPPEKDFWKDLLAEGVIDREDLSACSSGVGVEVLNVDV